MIRSPPSLPPSSYITFSRYPDPASVVDSFMVPASVSNTTLLSNIHFAHLARQLGRKIASKMQLLITRKTEQLSRFAHLYTGCTYAISPRDPLLRAQFIYSRMRIRIRDTIINTPLHDARLHSRYTSDAINHAKHDDPR